MGFWHFLWFPAHIVQAAVVFPCFLRVLLFHPQFCSPGSPKPFLQSFSSHSVPSLYCKEFFLPGWRILHLTPLISQGSCSLFIHLSSPFASSKLGYLSLMLATNWTESVQQILIASSKSLIKRSTKSYPKIRPLWYSTYQPEGWVSPINHGASSLHLFFLLIYLSLLTDCDISIWTLFCGRICQKICSMH